MIRRAIQFASVMLALSIGVCLGQEPPKEMEHLKNDVGTWDAEIKLWGDPSAEPEVTKGTETNFMLGGMWLITHFKGDMMGMAFEGSSQVTFNPETKKYTGTWVDSMSPYAMDVEGTWDDATKTLTQTGKGKDMTGNEMSTKMTTVYNKDGTRTFTMFVNIPDAEPMKVMEIKYTKAKETSAKPAAAK